MPTAKLGKLLRANADVYFPVDTQDCRLVWQVIGVHQSSDGAKEQSVQLWAVPKAMLQPYYQVANGCGLSVLAIDYCGHGMATAAGASFAAPVKSAKKEKKKLSLTMELGGKKKKEAVEVAPVVERQRASRTDLYLFLNKEVLGMVFVQRGQVVMQRIIRCGSQPSYQFAELSMMLEYFRSMDMSIDSEINGFVSGYYAQDPYMVAELADMLDLTLYPMTAEYEPQWSLCLAAVYTDLDFGIPTLNVADKARREMRNQWWQYGLLTASAVGLMAVVMFTLTSRLAWDSTIRGLENTKQTLMIQAQKVNGFADNYYEYENMYNQYSEDWETVFANLQTYNDNLVLVLDELEELMPAKSSVAAMQIGSSGLDVTFACETKEEAAYLIMALREMQYADLMAISDLQGGGDGPAKTYGSKKESAPKEGSSDYINGIPEADWYELVSMVQDDLSAYVVGYNMGLGHKTEELMADLESAYGLKLNNTYSSLVELQKAAGSKLTYYKRSNAFEKMCTTNPFTMAAAESNVMNSYAKDMTLADYILQKMDDEGYNVAKISKHTSPADLQDDIEIMVDIVLDEDEYDALAAVERLICDDPAMEAWYVYYLEAELNGKTEVMPYLDMEKVVSDLVKDGKFDSSSAALNAKLFSLLSSKTRARLNAVLPTEPTTKPTEGPTTAPTTKPTEGPTTAPTTKPTEGPTTAPTTKPTEGPTTAPTTKPTEGPTTGPTTEPTTAPTEAPTTEPTEPSTETNPMYETYIKTYLPTYLKEDEIPLVGSAYKGYLDKYFEEGKSGTEYDNILDDYIAEKKADEILIELMTAYEEDPDSLKNQHVRKMLDNYYSSKKTTGNKVLDAWIDRCEPEQVDTTDPNVAKLTGWLDRYMNYGQTYDAEADAIIVEYLTTGAVKDHEDYTKTLDSYVRSGKIDRQLKAELTSYLYNGATSIKPLKTMFDNYFNNKTTGSKAMDARVANLGQQIVDEVMGGSSSGSNGSTGSTGGQQAAPQDTRIYFAVILNYNDALRYAELNRKGLYYSDKIDMLEVGE